ncbi:hypothetical protein [Paenibacillus sp.]|uniref:hypothetical protein n=1 Tax=Paenibacillus sp. TaxID=58172 RepID=UPI002D3A0CBF|nr:hypothetical protein [Paenibacillus sp.]HZG84375.1 hypothetical protein [Paenibacillus sp.]
MIGSWRWNGVAAGALGTLIFLLSFSNNPLSTAAYRAGVSFAMTFALTYAVRWMIGKAIALTPPPEPEPAEGEAAEEEGKGAAIDIVTPEEDEAPQFTPLSPPKLTKTDQEIDPEFLAQALRHMSEK